MQHVNLIKSERGITVVELVAVMVIIGILTAIAAPTVDLGRYRAESAMQGVGSLLLGAQRRAMTRQYDIVVMFDEAQEMITIHDDSNNNGQIDGGERLRNYPLEEVDFGRGSAPALGFGGGAVTFTEQRDNKPAVIFHRNGSASEWGGLYLMATSRNRQSIRAIEIERSTGRASWYRFAASGWERNF